MSNCTSERNDAEKAPSAVVSVGRPLMSDGATAVICFCVSAYLLAVPILRSWICVLSACYLLFQRFDLRVRFCIGCAGGHRQHGRQARPAMQPKIVSFMYVPTKPIQRRCGVLYAATVGRAALSGERCVDFTMLNSPWWSGFGGRSARLAALREARHYLVALFIRLSLPCLWSLCHKPITIRHMTRTMRSEPVLSSDSSAIGRSADGSSPFARSERPVRRES